MMKKSHTVRCDQNCAGEVEAIRDRYDRRRESFRDRRYSPLDPCNYMWRQEKERALIRWIKQSHVEPLCDKKMLEIGCGDGTNLLQLIRLGFVPENLKGNDLLDERVQIARKRLPSSVDVIAGDASELNLPENSFDIVYQSTVFSSILDKVFQNKLAEKMWSFVKPGGGILWYDFIYDNPNNQDVVGIPIKRIAELFPSGAVSLDKITLAPPISRFVTKIHPSLYHLFNAFVFLRTHVLCWIKKVE